MSIAYVIAQAATKASPEMVNGVLRNTTNAIVEHAGEIQSASGSVLLGLATIELILFLYKSYLAPSEAVVKALFEKLFCIFAVAILTFNWGTIANEFKGYIVSGAAVGGGASASVRSLNPAKIAYSGFDKVGVLLAFDDLEKYEQGLSLTPSGGSSKEQAVSKAAAKAAGKAADKGEEEFDPMASVVSAISETGEMIAIQVIALAAFLGLALAIIAVHFYVAFVVFYLTIDWYITVTLTQMLVPFGVNKHTSNLASSGFQAVVRKSIQLGVLVMLLGMFDAQIGPLVLDASPNLKEVLEMFFCITMMAYAISKSPQIAGAIFTGAGSGLDIGAALQAASSSAAGALTRGAAPKKNDKDNDKKNDPNNKNGGRLTLGQGMGKMLASVGQGVGAGAKALGEGLGSRIAPPAGRADGKDRIKGADSSKTDTSKNTPSSTAQKGRAEAETTKAGQPDAASGASKPSTSNRSASSSSPSTARLDAPSSSSSSGAGSPDASLERLELGTPKTSDLSKRELPETLRLKRAKPATPPAPPTSSKKEDGDA